MWEERGLSDLPISARLDDRLSLTGLGRHLHPGGLQCPRCGRTARRLFRDQGHAPAYRCRAWAAPLRC